jgi:effector-binding domain-containing protein
LDHIERLNNTIEYIEANLDKNIHLELLASKFALSKYHFHRIFKALIGDPPFKYIEKRRLSGAAADLIKTDKRIIDIPKDMQSINIPESTYAVFKHKGPVSEIEQTYDRIYGSWFPLTGNIPTMDLDIIVIDHRFKRQSNDSVLDILIPIKG